MRVTVAVLLTVATVVAGEVDVKTQARTTWTEAAKAGDVWSCLQLEAWAHSRKPAVRFGSLLGDSTVLGETLFAAPSHVSFLADQGERVVFATYDRAYVIAPDGRPLQSSVKLLPEGGWQTLGYGGHVLGTCRRIRPETPAQRPVLEFGSTKLANADHPVGIKLELTPVQSWGDATIVADDGTALATVVNADDGPSGRTIRNVVIATRDKTRFIDHCRDPVAVGRNGAWLVAQAQGREAGTILVRGDRRQQVAAAAGGPGIAGCVLEGKAVLIKADGADVPLTGAPAVGDYAGMVTVGTWLVMGSGYGAKVVSDGDLLGDNVGATVEQPSTLAFWRWAELAKDPAAKPVTTMLGDLSQASDYAAALWVWKDTSLDLLDLSGAEPVRSHYLDAAAPIRWATTDQHCLRLEHEKPQRFALYGPDKTPLWAGECSEVLVKRRDLAISRTRGKDEHDTWRLQWLSADPAKRRSLHLPLPAEVDRIQVSVSAPDMVLARGPGGAWWTFGFDGKAQSSGNDRAEQGPERPSCPEMAWFAPTGRFYRDGPRIYEKRLGLPEEPLQRLALQDAWRVSGSTMLLDSEGRVWLSGRRRGEWLDLGVAGGAQRIGLRGTAPALVRDEARVVATVMPGPKLNNMPEAADGQELPASGGPWRLDDGLFTPPRGRQLEWDGDRVGLRDARLRSPEGSGLFIITASALIELDPDAARFFGK